MMIVFLVVSKVENQTVSGGPVKKISDFFGKDTYTDQETYPRTLCDVDGDGNDDIVGFLESGVQVAFSNGVTMDTPVELSTEFKSVSSYG